MWPAETCWFFPSSDLLWKAQASPGTESEELGCGSVVSSCSEIHSFTLSAPAVSHDDHSLSSSKVFSKRTVSLNLTGVKTEKQAPCLSIAQQDDGRVVAGFVFRAPWTQKQVFLFREEKQNEKGIDY